MTMAGAFPGFWSEGGLIIPNGNFCPKVLFLLIFRYLLRILTFKYILIKLNNKCICKFLSKYFYKPCHCEKKLCYSYKNCYFWGKIVIFLIKKLSFFRKISITFHWIGGFKNLKIHIKAFFVWPSAETQDIIYENMLRNITIKE